MKTLITGGHGFLGRHLCEELSGQDFVTFRHEDFNLIDQQQVNDLFDDVQPTRVIHLAAEVGGIGANREQPGRFFYANMQMGLNVLEECRFAEVEKLVMVGTVCAYPKFTYAPFQERDLWEGYPEETNAPYGVAKRALLTGCQAYRQQYGLNAIYLLPVNLYGSGDNFDPGTSHVIPALIKKMVDAIENGDEEIVLWGDGSPTREFLHVRDAAHAIALAIEHYDGPEPVNLGTGHEISIKDLAELVAAEVGYGGSIKWDTSMPNGQPRRLLDVSQAKELFAFEAQIPFHEGLHETVVWYQQQRAETYEHHPTV